MFAPRATRALREVLGNSPTCTGIDATWAPIVHQKEQYKLSIETIYHGGSETHGYKHDTILPRMNL